jgi:hypothetical protein
MRGLILGLSFVCLVACGSNSSNGGSGSNQPPPDAGSGTPQQDGGSGGTPQQDGGTQQTFNLQVQIQGGSGSVTSSPDGINCGSQCSATFAAGTSVLLTATAGAGQQFVGWSGPCGGDATCTVTLTSDTMDIANFGPAPAPPPPKPQHTLTVVLAGTGSGSVTSSPGQIACGSNCQAKFDEGTAVLLDASPAIGSQFSGWSSPCGGTGACTVTMSGDVQITATFSPAPAPAACAGIANADAVPMQQLVHQAGLTNFSCLPGVGDIDGTLALGRVFRDPNAHGSSFNFVSKTGLLIGDTFNISESPHPVQQIRGLSVWGDPGHLNPLDGQAVFAVNYDTRGSPMGTTIIFGSNIVGAAVAREGVLLAGDLSRIQSGPFVHSVLMLTPGDEFATVRWGPTRLDSLGAVFGAGVDRSNRSIVITSGAAKFGGGTISAQWFDGDGTPMTGEFLLLSNFTPGDNTWFETSSLIGNGVVVRRMDVTNGVTHAQPLVVVQAGSTQVQPAPSWMTSRPDTRLQIARGERAYAFLPLGAPGVSCSQRVDLVAPDGSLCGATNYPIRSGTCDTLDLSMGEDGTVIQSLPTAMETQNFEGFRSCTWRWWAAALR